MCWYIPILLRLLLKSFSGGLNELKSNVRIVVYYNKD